MNSLWATDHEFVSALGVFGTNQPTAAGFGYSYGAGFGYEAGNGLRADVTLDGFDNKGLTDGLDTLELRGGVALANAYYDFPIMGTSGSGGFGAYVGAGLGGAYYQTTVTDNVAHAPVAGVPDGSGFTAAGAAMAGVTYDMSAAVADLGYRLIYMPQVSNGQAAIADPAGPFTPFYINQNLISEVRGTLRYRFN
jgi:opacity protein-like surface antigen